MKKLLVILVLAVVFLLTGCRKENLGDLSHNDVDRYVNRYMRVNSDLYEDGDEFEGKLRRAINRGIEEHYYSDELTLGVEHEGVWHTVRIRA